MYGEERDDRLGRRVVAAGDTDGDGLADFAVAAPWSDTPGADAGVVYVVTEILSGTLGADASAAKLRGEAAYDKLGEYGMDGGFDLDGDGHADLVAGSNEHATGGTNAGAANLAYGPLSGVTEASDGVRVIGETERDRAGV